MESRYHSASRSETRLQTHSAIGSEIRSETHSAIRSGLRSVMRWVMAIHSGLRKDAGSCLVSASPWVWVFL
jgi:tRNA threonylcarbamoyladenosine modification (KEOPS) complex  Pcc1 subunit